MNVFQQLTSGNKYRVLHAARVFFIQDLDLREKHGSWVHRWSAVLTNMKKVLVPLVFPLVMSLPSFAQQEKVYQHFEQFWFQYFNQTRLSEKWGLWFDMGYRTKDNFTEGTSTLLARIGAIYYLNKEVRLMGGYAFFNAYPLEASIEIAQPEHRLWQQVLFQKEYPKLTLTNAVRFEQRWRKKILPPDRYSDEYNFNYRLRFGINLQYPLSPKKLEKGDLSLMAGNEVMLNLGKQIVYNFLDQNRIWAGFRYYFNTNNNLTVLYMNSFGQTPVPGLYRIFNTVRISYFHNIDLKNESQ
jgi:Protein of unknown function (DUF2490)